MSFSLKTNVTFDDSNTSAFGTLETAEFTPLVQLDFVYGINTQIGTSSVLNSATVDTNAGRLRLQSGTNSAGSAIFNSKRTAKYRAGQGMTARFTTVFAIGTASNTQIAGCGNSTDGYFFGYNGTSFGILHRNNSVDTWIAQTTWNVDKCDGTGASAFNWNKQTGNVMMIKYPYLGYGDIKFFVQNSETGRFILVHTIKYTNSSQSTQVTNPNLGFYAQNLNSGNTTNLIMYVGSIGMFLVGKRSFVSNPRWAIDNNKASISTETSIIGIKNATSYNGMPNRGLVRLNTVTLATANNSVATLRIKIGATIGGTPVYTPINGSTADNGNTITSGNSIVSYDTAGTTVTGGTYIFNISVGSSGSSTIDLTGYDLYIAPSEIATFSVGATANTTVGVSVNWSEDI